MLAMIARNSRFQRLSTQRLELDKDCSCCTVKLPITMRKKPARRRSDVMNNRCKSCSFTAVKRNRATAQQIIMGFTAWLKTKGQLGSSATRCTKCSKHGVLYAAQKPGPGGRLSLSLLYARAPLAEPRCRNVSCINSGS